MHKRHVGGQHGLPCARPAQVGLFPHTWYSDFSHPSVIPAATVQTSSHRPNKESTLGKTEAHRSQDAGLETPSLESPVQSSWASAEASPLPDLQSTRGRVS